MMFSTHDYARIATLLAYKYIILSHAYRNN